MSAKDPNQDFGANEWLVDEMYERYVSDPTSLEPSWIEFFKTYNPNSSGSTCSTSSTSSTSAPIAGAPRGGTPPTPKAAAAPVAPAPVATPAPVAATPAPAPVVPTPVAPPASNSAGTVITMPALGESVSEGTVTRWLKNVGDSVAMDEALLEVSTDKVEQFLR